MIRVTKYLEGGIPMTIGEKLKILREKRNISLRRLAEITALSKTTLNDLERGIKNPSFETVERIAKAFSMTTVDFLRETASPEDLVDAAKSSGSELLEALSTSEKLIATLFRAKDKPKEELDEFALFLEAYMNAKNV